MNKKLLSNSFKHTYIFIDFDDTLFSNDDKRNLLEPNIIPILLKLKKKNNKLIISSRNPPYIVEDILMEHKLLQYFDKIIADFRKKRFHIKQVLMDDNLIHDKHTLVIFIDDYIENCQDVANSSMNLKASLLVINYKTKKPFNLENILSLILDENYKELEKISIKSK